MSRQDDLNVGDWGTDSSKNILYWPFEVVPPDVQTEQQHKELQFLQTAFEQGFRPCLWHGEYRAISPTGREVWVIWRGHRRKDGPIQWEVRLFIGKHKLGASFWLDDFESVSVAGLNWLRGCELGEVLALIQGRIVKGPLLEGDQGEA
jgi:hypothetical protein